MKPDCHYRLCDCPHQYSGLFSAVVLGGAPGAASQNRYREQRPQPAGRLPQETPAGQGRP